MGLGTTTSLPKKIVIITITIVFTHFHNTFSQVLGLEPPSTKWKIIHTGHASIIFEPQAEKKAQRVANIINYIAERDSSFIGGPAQYVPIILHSHSTLPAGVPNLAPWRSDWSLATPQDPFFGTLLWIDGLSIHEYRHHQQMTMAKHGWFSDILRVVLGQTGWYVGVLTIQPGWFFEGDATYTETVLSNGGRGRMPKFDREYRTLRLSGLHYNYEKASRFSRKDFVPNIYREGYYLTSFARKHYGTDIWTRVLNDTYKRKGFFYPFNRSLKDLTGLRTKDLYRATMKELDSIWIAQDNNLQLTESQPASTRPKKIYTDYKFPHYTTSGNILVEKSSFQQIRSYVELTSNGDEKKLFQPGNLSMDHLDLTLTGDIMCWAENRFDPRWDLKDYSVIFTYNLKTNQKKRLTSKSKYYTPSISSKGDRIVVQELLTDGNQKLVLIDSGTGQMIKDLPNPGNGQFAYPRFSEDDKNIITGYTDTRGNTLRLINIETEEVKDLLPFSNQVITRPFDRENYIYFSGTHTGINNIFALNKNNGRMFQVTSSRFGAYMPVVSADSHKLLFSEYTSMGFEVREMDLIEDEWAPFELDTPSSLNYYKSLAEAEGGSITEKVPDSTYQVQKYRPLIKGLFNFHSWTPSLDQNEFGLELIGKNIMTNTATTIGYRYNYKENSSVSYGKLSYGALFPIFDLGYSYNIRNSKYLFDDQYSETEYKWRESELFGGIRIPLRLSSGYNSTNLNLAAQYDYFTLLSDTLQESISQEKYFGALEGSFEFSRLKRRAIRQILPVWGQQFSLNYKRSFEDQDPAELFYSKATLFFPGFSRTHAFYAVGAYQKENLKNTYRFENKFVNGRGYLERYFSDTYNTDFEEVKQLSLNYLFPLAFPDIDLGSIAYFQSVTADLFYDHTIGTFNGGDTMMRSAGVDIGFEFTSLRLFRTSIILRTLYRFDQPDPELKPFLFDFVFEITDLAF